MLLILLIIVGVHVQLNFLVKKTDTISPAVSMPVETPQLLTSAGLPVGETNVRVGFFERLNVSPYDDDNRSTAWRLASTDGSGFSEIRYVCTLDYSLVYTLYFFDIPVFESPAPGSDYTWTLIDSRTSGNASGKWTAIRMPETISMSRDSNSQPTYT